MLFVYPDLSSVIVKVRVFQYSLEILLLVTDVSFRQTMVLMPPVVVLIGQFCRKVIGCQDYPILPF